MSAVVIGVDSLLESALATVLVAGSAGAAVYLGVLMLLAPDAVRDLRDKLRAAPSPQAAQDAIDPLAVTQETDVIA